MSNYRVEVANLYIEKHKLSSLQAMFQQLTIVGGLIETAVENRWELLHTLPVLKVRVGFDTANPDPFTGEEQDFIEKLIELAVTEAIVTAKIYKRLEDRTLSGWAVYFNGKGHRIEQDLSTMEVFDRSR